MHAPAIPTDAKAVPAVPCGFAGGGRNPSVRDTAYFTMVQSTGLCSVLSSDALF